MQSRIFQYVMLGFWVTLILGILTREWWMPDPMKQQVEARNPTWLIGVAILLAGWNIVRIYSLSRPPVPTRVPLAEPVRKEARPPGVVAPEFQFDDKPRDS